MNHHTACINMIKQQLRTGDVLDDDILQLFKRIPREAFVPQKYQNFAYSDMQIELAHDQRMFTPLEEALILQALQLKKTERVLEVGTGTGFLTALMSQLAKSVVSIDYYQDFTLTAQKQLDQYQCNNAMLHTAEASQGWMTEAPFDVIVMSCAIPELTKTLRLQLAPGGRIFAIMGQAPVMQGMLYHLDHQERWHERLLFETAVPSIITNHVVHDFVF